MRSPRILLPVLAGLSLGSVEAVLIVDSSADENWRYSTDQSAFVGDGLNLTGVGKIIRSDGSTRWATLVASNIFVAAAHFNGSLSVGNTITFYPDNTGTGALSRTIAAFETLAGTDILIGRLSSAVPGTITSYTFATEPINNSGQFAASAIAGENAYWVGNDRWDSTSNIGQLQDRADETDFWVGRNVIDFYDNFTITSQEEPMSTVDVDPLGVPYETTLEGGDSGAPVFLTRSQLGLSGDPDELVLVGHNWYIVTTGGTQFNGMEYYGNHAEAIQGYINVNAVPEPEFMVFLGLGGLTLMRRRR